MAYIDLHLHLDGSLSLASARRLSKMAPSRELSAQLDALSDKELQERLSVGRQCHDLNEYLARFALPLSLLQTEEALSSAVYSLCSELQDRGYIYAELRFAPSQHTQAGLSQEAVVEAALDGLARAERNGFVARLILCCMRTDNEAQAKANAKTIEIAPNYIDKGVCAVDLAGAEALYATENFADLFLRAKELGLPYTIHAGEAAGVESVKAALDMRAVRIGHGQRATDDPYVLERLAKDNITLEVCPTSNINTKLYSSYSEVPLATFKKYGVPITICSDNMAVSMTDVPKELDELAQAFAWDAATYEERLLAYNTAALNAAFLDEAQKELLRQKL